MRRIASLIACVPLCLAGCTSPCGSTTGWLFQVGKPATVGAPMLVSQTSGPVGLAGVGTGGILHEVAAIGPTAPSQIVSRPPLAATSTCTLDDVCRRLALIEARVNQPPLRREQLPMPAPAKPMPRGDATVPGCE